VLSYQYYKNNRIVYYTIRIDLAVHAKYDYNNIGDRNKYELL